MNRIRLAIVATVGLAIYGCDSSRDSDTGIDQEGFQSALKSPVNVLEEYAIGLAQDISSNTTPATDSNLLSNGGFETDLSNWRGCGAEKLSITSDAYQGESAVLLESGTCFYQSVSVEPGSDYTVSCYARVAEGSGWSGLGLGFSDKDWELIVDSTPSLVTGDRYQRYDVKGTAPANAEYATVWMYTDNDVVFDSCVLLKDSIPPEPPSQQTLELLDDGEFNIVENNELVNWSNPCGGEMTVELGAHGNELVLGAGACGSQAFSSTDIAALKNNRYSLSCEVLKTQNWGTFGVSIDGVDRVLSIPHSSDYQVVSTGGSVDDITTGAFVIHLRAGTNQVSEVEPMRVRNCSLTVETTDTTEQVQQTNYLSNGSFDDLAANGNPDYWEKGCGGKWRSVPGTDNGNAVYLSEGACLNQFITPRFAAEESGNELTFSCSAKNDSGYADLTVFVDGVEHQVVVPPTGNFETVSLTVPAKEFSSVLAVLYSEGDSIFDNCELTAASTGNTPTVTGVNLLENPEFEDNIDGWRNACPAGFAEYSNGFQGLMYTGNGSCVHQHLSQEALDQLSGNNFEFSCTYTSRDDSYAGIATNLPDVTVVVEKRLPQTYFGGVPNWNFQTVTISGRAADNLTTPSPFVSLGSQSPNGMSVLGCSLVVVDP